MVKFAATEVGVLLSGRAELTPRPKAARAAKLRFSVAIWLICSELIRVLTTLESACTARASASTVTVCDSAPTVNLMSTRAVEETLTTIPFCANDSKPFAVTFML